MDSTVTVVEGASVFGVVWKVYDANGDQIGSSTDLTQAVEIAAKGQALREDGGTGISYTGAEPMTTRETVAQAIARLEAQPTLSDYEADVLASLKRAGRTDIVASPIFMVVRRRREEVAKARA